jgi:malonyl-CoA O-methyltransferase
MTDSNSPSALPINIDHVRRQFERRGDMADAQFLYGEVARRMLERLSLTRLRPAVILDAGCGVGHQSQALIQRYPDARLISQDHSSLLLKQLQQRAGLSVLSKFVNRLRRKPSHDTLCADLAQTGLPAESVDLIWSNLAIHWHPRPHDVLREWGRIVRPGGLVFFSGWGPATALEVRQAVQKAGIRTQTLPLVDMHDLGDLMIQHGFADPVMDQETLRLTYETGEALLRDVRQLGGNPSSERRVGLPGKAWRQRLNHAIELGPRQDNRLTLTIELAYGHAWRAAVRKRAGETRISLDAIGNRTRRET